MIQQLLLPTIDSLHDEGTPPPPSPPLQIASNRYDPIVHVLGCHHPQQLLQNSSSSHLVRQSDGSLPFPPPPTSSKEPSPELRQATPENSIAKLIRFPLKSKSKHADSSSEQPPDLCVNNVVAAEPSRVATIRKPHNPLKCPGGSKNVALVVIISRHCFPLLLSIVWSLYVCLSQAIDDLLASNDIAAGSSSANDAASSSNDRIYENSEAIKSNDHPYRTEMNLVLSYDGQKSKYSTSADKVHEGCTPPPNVPAAMKLLPNKLAYASNAANKTDKDTDAADTKSKEQEQSHVNSENDTNEEILTKSQVKFIVTDESNPFAEKINSSHEASNEDAYSVAGTSNENNKSIEKFDTVSVISDD